MRNGFIVVVWLLLISVGVIGWLGQTKYGWWSKSQVADTAQPTAKQSSGTPTAETKKAGADAGNTNAAQTKTSDTQSADKASAADTNNSASPQESADETQTAKSAAVPSFDIVRVEPDGTAVIAGRAEPGASVSVLVDGMSVVEGKADARGEWAFLVEKPISPGNHNVTLSSEASGKIVVSDQSVAIGLPEREDEKPLIVLSKKGEPSKILQAPAGASSASESKPEPQVETQVAAKQQEEPAPSTSVQTNSQISAATTNEPGPAPAASSVPLTLKTVDYDDEGNMIFTGTGNPKSSVRIYVNNKLIADAIVDLSGVWTLRVVKEVKPGNHYLRVDQITANSTVASRIELPFTRVDPKRVIAALNSGKLPKIQQPEAGKAGSQRKDGESTKTATVVEPAPSATPSTANSDAEVDAGKKLAVKESERAAGNLAASTAEPEETNPSLGGVSIVEQALSSSPAPTTSSEDTANTAAAVVSSAGPGIPSIEQQPEPAGAPVGAVGNVVQRVGRVIIQPGNNLWNISRVIYGSGVSYTAIYQANKGQIRDPHKIYPGQIFTTPGVVPPEQIQP